MSAYYDPIKDVHQPKRDGGAPLQCGSDSSGEATENLIEPRLSASYNPRPTPIHCSNGRQRSFTADSASEPPRGVAKSGGVLISTINDSSASKASARPSQLATPAADPIAASIRRESTISPFRDLFGSYSAGGCVTNTDLWEQGPVFSTGHVDDKGARPLTVSDLSYPYMAPASPTPEGRASSLTQSFFRSPLLACNLLASRESEIPGCWGAYTTPSPIWARVDMDVRGTAGEQAKDKNTTVLAPPSSMGGDILGGAEARLDYATGMYHGNVGAIYPHIVRDPIRIPSRAPGFNFSNSNLGMPSAAPSDPFDYDMGLKYPPLPRLPDLPPRNLPALPSEARSEWNAPKPLGSAQRLERPPFPANVWRPCPPAPVDLIVNLENGVSVNYQGNAALTRNHSEQIPEEINCAFWITGLAPDTTHREVLASVRETGRVYALVINKPAGTHQTSAAKIIFFDLEAAQEFHARTVREGFVVRGYQGHVSKNRIKTSPKDQDGPRDKSRVLVVKGSPAHANPTFLTALFREKFKFEIDEVVVRELNQHIGHVEYRFGSYRCQAEAGFQVLKRECLRSELNPDGPIWYLKWGRDPCDVFRGSFGTSHWFEHAPPGTHL